MEGRGARREWEVGRMSEMRQERTSGRWRGQDVQKSGDEGCIQAIAADHVRSDQSTGLTRPGLSAYRLTNCVGVMVVTCRNAAEKAAVLENPQATATRAIG